MMGRKAKGSSRRLMRVPFRPQRALDSIVTSSAPWTLEDTG
jgi:hypothetical protein